MNLSIRLNSNQNTCDNNLGELNGEKSQKYLTYWCVYITIDYLCQSDLSGEFIFVGGLEPLKLRCIKLTMARVVLVSKEEVICKAQGTALKHSSGVLYIRLMFK